MLLVLYFQSTRNFARATVLRSDRHVVAGLCDSGVVSRLATVSGLLRVRPNPLHLSNPGVTGGTHAKQRHQSDTVLHARKHRRQLSVLAFKGKYPPFHHVIKFTSSLIRQVKYNRSEFPSNAEIK